MKKFFIKFTTTLIVFILLVGLSSHKSGSISGIILHATPNTISFQKSSGETFMFETAINLTDLLELEERYEVSYENKGYSKVNHLTGISMLD